VFSVECSMPPTNDVVMPGLEPGIHAELRGKAQA
jgi:hypothetical protein